MLDCLIIGGGPAGLTAATYLGRFRRKVLIVDGGASRMKRIPLTRNAPGFPDGVTGAALYARMLDQALTYGAAIKEGMVEGIAPIEGGFAVAGSAGAFEARTILLATGSVLVEPAISGLEEGVQAGIIRYCPICDGLETRGRSVAVLGNDPAAIEEARFIRTFTDRVTFLWTSEAAPSFNEVAHARREGIDIAETSVRDIRLGDDGVAVAFADGTSERFDMLYPALGCAPQSGLLAMLGAKLSEDCGVLTDKHQRTEIAGVYAAGDVLEGLDQIASACGQAAIAAVTIHNDLRGKSELSS
ncbi:MAG: NAD(P)/FAD-dependent oxidoreductase [Terricaulis sp.]